MKIDFLSACYGCRLFMQQKFSSFAMLEHNPEIYLDEFQAWLGIPDRQIICKANRQQNHVASGSISNEKVIRKLQEISS